MGHFSAIKDKIESVEKEFDVVLMADNFTESMILLRNLLGWQSAEMTWLRLNSHTNSTSALSARAYACLEQWNRADMLLYDHFKRRFQESVEEYGIEKMREEVEKLNDLNSKVMDVCTRRGSLYGWPHIAYQCKLYAMDELDFINLLRNRQRDKARAMLGQNIISSRKLYE